MDLPRTATPHPTTAPVVQGSVAPGLEPVREAFAAGVADLGDGGGAIAVVRHDQLVVDLWCGQAAPDRPWQADTTAVLMSATKALVTVVIQLLVSRGRLDVDAPVARYWPEFAAAGKDSVTVRHVLTHTAGLLGFPGQEDHFGWDGRGWDDHDAIAAGLAAAPLSWPAGTRHGYHALSIGWILDALVRRITGRSTGRLFADEVAGPLGIEAWLGTPAEQQHRIARVLPAPDLPAPLDELYRQALGQLHSTDSLGGAAFIGGHGTSAYDHLPELMNRPQVQGIEIPAGNGTATARGLARLMTLLRDGSLDGVPVLSGQAIAAFDHVVLSEPDAVMATMGQPLAAVMPPQEVPRTLGYLGNGPAAGGLPRFGPSPAAYGAEGFGGQIAFYDPAADLGCAFVRNHMAVISTLGPQLVDALYGCLPRAGGDACVDLPNESRT